MKPTVAILNSNEDVLEMLRALFEDAGYNTVTSHVPHIKRGHVDLLSFLREHDPAAIVYDVAPPYKDNWTFFHLMKSVEAVRSRRIVVTTANKQLLESIIGEESGAYEISEKPYDLNTLLEAVERTLKRDAA